MRAVGLTELGAHPQMLELPVPEPTEGEIRVRVRAASVNGFDIAVANGRLKGMMEHRFPVVLGKDFAGTVDAVGAGVTDYAPGDRVFGVVTKPYLGDGSFAEYVVVHVSTGMAKLPQTVDFPEGGALGLAGAAAMAAVDAAGLDAGKTVLIAGATGGVGNQVIQLAATAGAHVIATVHSTAEKVLVNTLGAAEVVYYMEDIATQVLAVHPRGVDAVVHLAGAPAPLLSALRPGGRLVSTVLSSPDQLPSERAVVVPVHADPTRATLERLAENQASGRTRVVIQRSYTLDETTSAFADFNRGTLGKVGIIIG
ncbi:MAG TPA: NADP-dependent oxidoreductase [Gemmatimonadaceae bacterium]